MKNWTIRGPRRFVGELTPPPDKSITHRALLLAAVAEGTSRIVNPLRGADCIATARAIATLGAEVEEDGADLLVTGVGPDGFREPGDVIDVGNSGTLMRLLSGLVAGYPVHAILTGDASIQRRPMARIIEPLRLMGASVDGAEGGTRAPLRIFGGALHGIRYQLPVASAQVKSAILLAGLRAEGPTVITGIPDAPTRDHTERMLRHFGIDVEAPRFPEFEPAAVEAAGRPIEDGAERAVISGPVRLEARDVEVPGDISSAAFFIAGALAAPRSELLLRNVGWNATRLGMVDLLLVSQGIRIDGVGYSGSERVVEAVTITPGNLSGSMAVTPGGTTRMIDEVPIFAVACMARGGETIIRGIGELRHKESDRVESTVRLVQAFGGQAQVDDEVGQLEIRPGPIGFKPATIRSEGDHRIAMAAAIAACLADGESEIRDVECVDTSYPGFFEDLESITELV